MKLSLLLIPVATFLALAGAVLLAGILPGDPWLRGLVLASVPPGAVAVFRWVNYAGTWPVLAPVAVVLLAFPRVRRRWWVWLVFLAVAPLLEPALKWLIARPRPESAAFGFPSGHATAASAYFGALFYAAGDLPGAARRIVQALAAAVIALVAVTRVVLGAHWPSDALGGVALGLACVTGAILTSSSTGRSPSGSRRLPAPSPGAPSRTPPARG